MVELRCGAATLGRAISVAASFVWRCLSGSTMAPFPHPAHRTGHAAGSPALASPDLVLESTPTPLRALRASLGQEVTPSPTTGHAQARPGAPGLSLPGVRLVIADHASGLPVLRTLSLCTCCRHYPGAAAGRITSLVHPTVSAFPERVVGSACASSFSRLARRSLALRPAHSRRHQFVTRYPKASATSLPP